VNRKSVPPGSSRPANGGFPARRAVMRWAWRLFRREWRQQIQVIALLTIAIAVMVVGTSAAYNLAPVAANAEFGSANYFIRFEGSDPQTVDSVLKAANEWFGQVDAIASTKIALPGSVETVEFRTQNPAGPNSAPMLSLRAGRYPQVVDEVAVTDHVADMLGLSIGESLDLDGTTWKVVGIVENPSDLSDEFVLLESTQFRYPATITMLVDASQERVYSFQFPGGTTKDGTAVAERASNEANYAAVTALGVSLVSLVFVSLVAAAGFVVMAQRRQRELGMFAAIGASKTDLRFVMIANGAVTGTVAGLGGITLGMIAWVAAVPVIEPILGYRIDRFNMPWWLIGAALLLAVGTAIASSWWPASIVARIPVVTALSGRPPRAQPAGRYGLLAGILGLIGIVGLVWSDPSKLGNGSEQPFGDPLQALLIGVSALMVICGVLLAGPLAIRMLAASARSLPVAYRLALRDLDRNQARAGSALAAISLALGIASALVIVASAAEPTPDQGNLSDRQLIVWTRNADDPPGFSPFYTEDPNSNVFFIFVPQISADDRSKIETSVDDIAALFGEANITPLDVAVDPSVESGRAGIQAVALAEKRDPGYVDVALVYAASPELLRQHGIDPEAINPGTEILTVRSGDLWWPKSVDPDSQRTAPEAVSHEERITPGYSSIPGSLITQEALHQRNWNTVRVGWLIESSTPITSAQLANARGLAADAGVLIEPRDGPGQLVALRWPATGIGMLVALSVLTMTVGLIRGEAAGDVRTLIAVGATGSIRRKLVAGTAGAMTMLGALLGCVGAYVALGSLYFGDLGELSRVPVAQMLVIIIGSPLIAFAGGWLLAGRSPSHLSAQSIL
jgi:putative ABC transport system permease protein